MLFINLYLTHLLSWNLKHYWLFQFLAFWALLVFPVLVLSALLTIPVLHFSPKLLFVLPLLIIPVLCISGYSIYSSILCGGRKCIFQPFCECLSSQCTFSPSISFPSALILPRASHVPFLLSLARSPKSVLLHWEKFRLQRTCNKSGLCVSQLSPETEPFLPRTGSKNAEKSAQLNCHGLQM